MVEPITLYVLTTRIEGGNDDPAEMKQVFMDSNDATQQLVDSFTYVAAGYEGSVSSAMLNTSSGFAKIVSVEMDSSASFEITEQSVVPYED